MTKPSGIHHIAVMSADMKEHIEFFSDVLGCRLVGLFDMHGVPGAFHAFLELNPNCHFSLVHTPGTRDIAIELGKTHSGTGAAPCAPGTMQHLAFRVDDEAGLLNMRDRIRSRGVNVIGPINHGICSSIYFAGPDQLTLEVACPGMEMTPERWVDPDVLERLEISVQEAERYTAPDDYAGEGGAVPQPPYDRAKPHQAYPEKVYQQMLAAPDEAITAQASYSEPPVALKSSQAC